jgi:glycosyltransferase involved in cell wall biosynthesis
MEMNRPPMSGDAAPRPLHVWLLSPYHTGSHQAWATGYQAHSRHRVTVLGMAGRFWKWRMQGGAVELAAQAQTRLATGECPDAVLATDMVHLPVWLGLLRSALPGQTPVLCYMHENQLTYPWRPGEKPDLTYAMINWLSQLAADQVFFNSRYHLESWFDELPRLLKHYPDYNHLELVAQVHRRSAVLPVGIHGEDFAPAGASSGLQGEPAGAQEAPPLIVWNQRWEYDKRPDRFFALLYRLQEAQAPFRLAVAGENFRNIPAEFEEARLRLAERVVHWGYVPSRAAYADLLRQAALVISTADHEFFGISVLEAICAGAFPLLPNRLSYPELIPAELHSACLYANEDDLLQKTLALLGQRRSAPSALRRHILEQYDWPQVARVYDQWIAAAVEQGRSPVGRTARQIHKK